MRIRTLLFFAFFAVSVVPVVFLAFWVQRSALEREFGAVKDKHLLLAHNLTESLSRYAKYTELAFRTAATGMAAGKADGRLNELLSGLSFRHVYMTDGKGLIEKQQCILKCPPAERIPAKLFNALAPLLAQATERPGKSVFSGVMANLKGKPTVYLLRGLPGNRFAIGELSTDYFSEVQKSVTFGRRGHAAIVDDKGHVLAHPLAEWTAAMKDISKISIVQKMMAGETGVANFYLPAIKSDMIAGFSVTPITGWGVMIPQPVRELLERAGSVRKVAMGLSILGVLTAIGISWWLSGFLARPIRSITGTAVSVAAGEEHSRVETMSRMTPRELHELAGAFNAMMDRINAKNEKLTALADKARAANHSKTQFLANMSHELRTPLSAILGFSETMKAETFGPLGHWKYEEYTDDIQSSARHLHELIDDILDISAIEMEKLKLFKRPVDLHKMAREVVRVVQPAADRGGIVLYNTIDSGAPSLVADERRLKQILLNLLGNAVKYTPRDGEIVLSAGMNTDESVFIQVSDSGSGMTAADIESAFQIFGRGESTVVKDVEGSGLGLPLTKRLVEAHGGKLVLESREGRGTVVTISIPLPGDDLN